MRAPLRARRIPGTAWGSPRADFDGDGRTDLFVTNYGPDVLYRSLGDGRFEDVTASAGVAGQGWSSSAAFCDYDADGRLDLYVTRYVRNDPAKHCTQQDGSRDYCSPQVFPGTHDYLYRNLGGGRFEDVSLAAGLRTVHAPGLGVVCHDFDGDGRLDFYVANDGEANQLWLNQGAGGFVDDAFLAGVALNDSGRPEAGMGIALGDVDADLDLDLFITHVADETNTLYRSDGADLGLSFADRTGPSGLGPASMAMTGFGVGFWISTSTEPWISWWRTDGCNKSPPFRERSATPSGRSSANRTRSSATAEPRGTTPCSPASTVPATSPRSLR